MTLEEYARRNNIENTFEGWSEYFRNNMYTGKSPVGLYSCPICQNILFNFPDTLGCTCDEEGLKKLKELDSEFPDIEVELIVK